MGVLSTMRPLGLSTVDYRDCLHYRSVNMQLICIRGQKIWDELVQL